MFWVGGAQDNRAPPSAAAVTVIENAGSAVLSRPSLAVMTIFPYAPTWAAVGVPVNLPVAVLNDAHDGLFWIVNVSADPSGSEAVGWKE